MHRLPPHFIAVASVLTNDALLVLTGVNEAPTGCTEAVHCLVTYRGRSLQCAREPNAITGGALARAASRSGHPAGLDCSARNDSYCSPSAPAPERPPSIDSGVVGLLPAFVRACGHRRSFARVGGIFVYELLLGFHARTAAWSPSAEPRGGAKSSPGQYSVLQHSKTTRCPSCSIWALGLPGDPLVLMGRRLNRRLRRRAVWTWAWPLVPSR